VDAKGPEDCSPEGNLPDAEAGPAGTYGTDKGTASTVDTTPGGHLRKVTPIHAEATAHHVRICCLKLKRN
jgi:hypothetical protein